MSQGDTELCCAEVVVMYQGYIKLYLSPLDCNSLFELSLAKTCYYVWDYCA